MNRSELLDKLAMELAEWPEMWDSELQERIPEVIEWQLHHSPYLCGDDLEKIYKPDYLQRRAELINCPPDSEAPEWAKWKAQDSDGWWCWFAGKPVVEGTAWHYDEQPHRSKGCQKGETPNGHRWQNTLAEVKHRIGDNTRMLDNQLAAYITAHGILNAAAQHMQDRAATYDKPEGERSMSATVQAFNAVTGDGLMNTEERGWLFMQLLKAVRSQQGDYRADSYEDGAAYVALAGEAAAKERT